MARIVISPVRNSDVLADVACLDCDSVLMVSNDTARRAAMILADLHECAA